MKIPQPWPHEFHAFFGSPNSEDDNETTLQVHEAEDSEGVRLRFSFDWLRATVQTELMVRGAVIDVVSHEDATSVAIDGFELTCTFESETAVTTCVITLTPRIRVAWSHLLATTSWATSPRSSAERIARRRR